MAIPLQQPLFAAVSVAPSLCYSAASPCPSDSLLVGCFTCLGDLPCPASTCPFCCSSLSLSNRPPIQLACSTCLVLAPSSLKAIRFLKILARCPWWSWWADIASQPRLSIGLRVCAGQGMEDLPANRLQPVGACNLLLRPGPVQFKAKLVEEILLHPGLRSPALLLGSSQPRNKAGPCLSATVLVQCGSLKLRPETTVSAHNVRA